jgi:RHS repeat-associated protein
VLNEESGTGSGILQKTYIGRMAEITGSTPATGAYSYYATDNPCPGKELWRSRVGSPRAVYSQAKALVAELDYGQAYTANDTVGITHRYTGHDWDATAALYFAPYRFYNPQLARWMSRDPLGMVDGPNVYAYVRLNPINAMDREGTISCNWQGLATCLALVLLCCYVGACQFCLAACGLCALAPGPWNPACWACAGCIVVADVWIWSCVLKFCRL